MVISNKNKKDKIIKRGKRIMKNEFILHGRLSKDPTLKTTPNGVPIAIIDLAVQKGFKDKDGNIGCDFLQIQFYDKIADNCCRCLAKGSEIIVSGRITQQSYTNKENKQVSKIVLYGTELDFCGKRSENFSPKPNEDEKPNPVSESHNLDALDDDLPF